MIQKILSYLKEIHSSSSDASAKRFYGGIGFLMTAITIISAEHGQLGNLLITSAGLIGLGVVETLFKK